MTEDELRAAIQTEARTWLGTPHIHQACKKGVGVDCGMFVRAVGEAVGVLHITKEEWGDTGNYGRRPNPRRMLMALEKFFVRIPASDVKVADVMYLDWSPERNLPMHLAILAQLKNRHTMIHALARPGTMIGSGNPAGRVVEHGFTAEWPERVHSWWRYPGLAKAQGKA